MVLRSEKSGALLVELLPRGAARTRTWISALSVKSLDVNQDGPLPNFHEKDTTWPVSSGMDTRTITASVGHRRTSPGRRARARCARTRSPARPTIRPAMDTRWWIPGGGRTWGTQGPLGRSRTRGPVRFLCWVSRCGSRRRCPRWGGRRRGVLCCTARSRGRRGTGGSGACPDRCRRRASSSGAGRPRTRRAAGRE